MTNESTRLAITGLLSIVVEQGKPLPDDDMAIIQNDMLVFVQDAVISEFNRGLSEFPELPSHVVLFLRNTLMRAFEPIWQCPGID